MKQPAPTCTGLTNKGMPCRNRAQRGSSRARCRHHVADVRDEVRTVELAPAHPSAPGSDPHDLSAELRLVRDVLTRLADRLDDPSYTLLPDDMRSLATLIFSGVRTVAYLIARQEDASTDLQTWLDQALDTLSSEFTTEL